MPQMMRFRLLVLILLVFPWTALAQGTQEPRRAGGETVDVEIKMIPFYAVDAQGKPVYDLRQDEVELRVGGKTVPLDTLDGYPMTAVQPDGVQSKRAAPPSRRVVFLFDTAFSNPTSLRNARLVAGKLLDEVPAGDRISLLLHSAGKGLETKLRATRADERGKARLREEIAKLNPEVHRISTDENQGMPPVVMGKGGNRNADIPTAQFSLQLDQMKLSARSEYEGVARQLADSLELAAADLRRQPGPKLLLLFWQGIDSTLFFEGDIGVTPGGKSRVTHMDGRRFSGLMTKFTEPLHALADSGTVTAFVNADNPHDVGYDSEGPLRFMAQTAGGVYAGGGDPNDVERQVAASTAAYYEAGFYLRGPQKAAREEVEIVVRRPGVRVSAPATLKVRDTYDGLTSFEKRLLVLDLVAGGPEAQRARSAVRLDLRDLGGKVLGRPGADGGRRLRFDAAWPAELAGKELDLYNVMLAPPGPRNKESVPTVLRFDQAERAHPGAAPLETALGKDDSVIWGIVAVEPGTGRAWYKRLQLERGGR
jgi:hypothetical protein